MKAYDIIEKKRDGNQLSSKEISWFVQSFSRGEIPDYQMTAFLMAVYLKKMTQEETAWLTQAMVDSGATIDLREIQGIKVDKHSTGGVGDTTTLILAPLVAACGVPVPKLSGRGLGHTGGTLDKLESIPGFNVNLTREQFIRQVQDIGVAVASQTQDLVPADKKMYALRDVTATIDSIPLIASSVMSKKIASGADAIVLDVKQGDGAFMKEKEMAVALARSMVAIGENLGRKCVALVTSMDNPLGTMIGNSLEVREAIEILSNRRGGRLREVSVALGGYMVWLGGKAATAEEGQRLVQDALEQGKGIRKFAEMIRAQGGDVMVTENPEYLPQAKIREDLVAESDGFLGKILAETVGKASWLLGAGREKKEDPVDLSVGMILTREAGEKVKKGEVLAELHANSEEKLQKAKELLKGAFVIQNLPPAPSPLILEVVKGSSNPCVGNYRETG